MVFAIRIGYCFPQFFIIVSTIQAGRQTLACFLAGERNRYSADTGHIILCIRSYFHASGSLKRICRNRKLFQYRRRTVWSIQLYQFKLQHIDTIR